MDAVIRKIKELADRKQEVCVLEYSRYSDDRNMFPYHVFSLTEHIQNSERQRRERDKNMWSVIYIGSWKECFERLKEICPDE